MLARHSFMSFLAEANRRGSAFEERVAGMVQKWLSANGLSRKWKAYRYQTLREDDGKRDEDFSDVAVEELGAGERFFVECKEFEAANAINVRFDIGSDGGLFPVRGTGRERLAGSEAAAAEQLTAAVRESPGFSEFVEFLNRRTPLLRNLRPADFWDDPETDDAKRFVGPLVSKYNKVVRSGGAQADCKEFDAGSLRESTLNQLVVALCWRLSDPSRTWDICRAHVPGAGRMLRKHYSDEMAEPARYVQFGEDSLFATSSEDPLGISAPQFPEDAECDFWLKFTPRFGVGGMYVTPRSEMTTELSSPCTFLDEERWPKTGE